MTLSDKEYIEQFIDKHSLDDFNYSYDSVDDEIKSVTILVVGLEPLTIGIEDVKFDIDVDMPADALEQWLKCKKEHPDMSYTFWTTSYDNKYRPIDYGQEDIDNIFTEMDKVFDNLNTTIDEAFEGYSIEDDSDSDELDEDEYNMLKRFADEAGVDINDLENDD